MKVPVWPTRYTTRNHDKKKKTSVSDDFGVKEPRHSETNFSDEKCCYLYRSVHPVPLAQKAPFCSGRTVTHVRSISDTECSTVRDALLHRPRLR